MNKFFFLLLFISCTAFKVEDPESGEEFLLKETKKINFCKPSNFQLIGSNSFAVNDFGTFLKKKKNLTTYEKFALWALLQMNIHPDSSSPFSKLQIIVWDKGQMAYFDYNDKNENSTTFLDGLNHFLSITKQKNNLKDLGKVLDKEFNQPIPIGEEFANFLKQNRGEIEKNLNLKPFYFKANQLITEKETLPPLNFSNLLNQRKNNFQFNSTLYSEHIADTATVCNKNLLTIKTFIGPNGISNHFAIKEEGLVILGVSSGLPDLSNSIEKTFLFKGKNRNFNPIICSLKKGDNSLLLISGKDKAPGQHLYHLLEEDLLNDPTFENLDNNLNKFRFITLRNPKRIIIESRRASDKDLGRFLNSKIPVYSIATLGNIWGYGHLITQDGFLKDPRNESYLFCE